jgi:hypothetical protein
VGKAFKLTGAVIAVALLLGLGWWGFSALRLFLSGRVPAVAKACLPTKAQKSELWGKASQGQDTYYLIGGYQGRSSWEMLVVVRPDQTCKRLYPADPNSSKFFYPSQFVSVDTARQLVLQRFSREIQRYGSREKFETTLRNRVRQSEFITYFAPEEGWAFQELKVSLPRGAMILDK